MVINEAEFLPAGGRGGGQSCKQIMTTAREKSVIEAGVDVLWLQKHYLI